MSGRVLIVDALAAGNRWRKASRDTIGVGPRSVAGAFERNQVDCRIVRAEDLLERPGRMRRFDHLAVSAMSMDEPAAGRVIRLWRGMKSKGIVMVGGPISSSPDSVLRVLKPDILVVGEGEATLHELLNAGLLDGQARLAEIHGIGYLERGRPVVTPARRLISAKDLTEQVPSTDRIVDYSAYQACRVYVEVLRGCSNFRRPSVQLPDGRICSDCGNCTSENPTIRTECPESIPPGCGFCSVPATWGPPRSRGTGAILTEIETLLDAGVHRIVLEAPDFLDFQRDGEPVTDPCSPPANLRALNDLLSGIGALEQIKNGSCHVGIENVKACLFSDEVARTIAETIGPTSPNIGLETGSDEHMRRIGKCGTSADVKRAVATARRYGMSPFVYLIYGLPDETSQAVEESVRMMRDLIEAGAERIILYGFQPLPGSAFAEFPASSTKSNLNEAMRTVAEDLNRARKDRYVGTLVKGVAAEPSLERHGFTMVYPLGEGPMMTVQGGYSPGTLVYVRVTRVLSAGLVSGEVVAS